MKKRVAVFFGRFAPPHNGHIANIEYCKENYDETIVFIGSSNKRRSLKNPFPTSWIEQWIKSINPNAVVTSGRQVVTSPMRGLRCQGNSRRAEAMDGQQDQCWVRQETSQGRSPPDGSRGRLAEGGNGKS